MCLLLFVLPVFSPWSIWLHLHILPLHGWDGNKVFPVSFLILPSSLLCYIQPPTFPALCRTSFQCTYAWCALGDTKWDTELGMWPHKCWTEKDHFYQTCGCILDKSSRDADGHFLFQGHTAGSDSSCPPAPSVFSAVTFSLPGPISLLLVWDSSKTQDFTFYFAELHEFNISHWK